MEKLNKTILVVEDEKAMVEALGQKFKDAGFDVIKAFDGEEGLKIALKERPDLIMLDIIMPKMDGISFLKRIREDDRYGGRVPIIMLTNLSDADNVSEAAKYNVYDFLVKTDWRLDDVVKLVKEKLELN
jgi:two-component system alkaline phosphatase synthesis response regulator PhoP